MATTTIVIAVVVVIAVVALALLFAVGLRQRRSQRLRQRFGAEYERVVSDTGDRAQAERALEERVERRRTLPIHDLDEATRVRYLEEWRVIQLGFVDDPRGALRRAEELITRLMRDRGYPVEDFDQQVADVSVDHAQEVGGFRRAHQLTNDLDDKVGTDALREAMVRYRDMFEGLLGERVTSPDGEAARQEVRR
jgi:hypothetical protein